ncbi:replication protein A 70 kDa DNA-binding subunit B-like [Raphanus sativus]|nr:replication protein A 70 kDa DNA-binding subunit B-like [Raphanus sativus]
MNLNCCLGISCIWLSWTVQATPNFCFLIILPRSLFGKQCLELTGPISNENEETDVLPAAITNLIGKTSLFKIAIEKENYQYKLDTFKVVKIITNNDLISEFVDTSPLGSQNTNGPNLSIMSEAPEFVTGIISRFWK